MLKNPISFRIRFPVNTAFTVGTLASMLCLLHANLSLLSRAKPFTRYIDNAQG